MTDIAGLNLRSTYADELDGMYVSWQGEAVPEPVVLRCNETLARSLGLDPEALTSPVGASILSGAKAPDHAKPLAMAYAGHQFGNFSQQLGDGRALLLGELADESGQLFDLHLKGSGPTPFSRGGDGKAGIGPVLREYLVAEAMHALGVPTTRALAAVSTGETIQRDPPQPGAVLARTATSHLRVGTFQFFAARQDTESVAKLVRFALTRHGVDPEGNEALALLRSVVERQAHLVALWMNLGFVHGVMNTDNTTISGETIDYGPCAFMERYDPNTVFSSIDHAGRYRYGNQPAVMQWNLARFAETLLPLLERAGHRRSRADRHPGTRTVRPSVRRRLAGRRDARSWASPTGGKRMQTLVQGLLRSSGNRCARLHVVLPRSGEDAARGRFTVVGSTSS